MWTYTTILGPATVAIPTRHLESRRVIVLGKPSIQGISTGTNFPSMFATITADMIHGQKPYVSLSATRALYIPVAIVREYFIALIVATAYLSLVVFLQTSNTHRHTRSILLKTTDNADLSSNSFLPESCLTIVHFDGARGTPRTTRLMYAATPLIAKTVRYKSKTTLMLQVIAMFTHLPQYNWHVLCIYHSRRTTHAPTTYHKRRTTTLSLSQ